MSADKNKPWDRPWSTDEIVENAWNWNLAADVGLLKHLEQFSENLLRKANATNDNLDNLLQNLTNASLSLDIARNQFVSLSNTQFIESRVYEDDETLPSENEEYNNIDKSKQNEEDHVADMKDAVMKGLEVVDKYFDKVEVPASDTEDETDFPSFVLRPKDPYLDRPLPYVIGSEEWHKKWHVGLAESSSDSETEKVSEKFSDTDSESDLPVVNRQVKSVSESGSEADLSNRIQGDGPVANSTFNDTNRQFFGSSSSEEFNSVTAQAPISQNNFAEQLAAKLGNVIANNKEVPEPEVNKRPIQKASGIRDFGSLFANEPPPLEDDLFGSKSNQHGVFSGDDGLFDDLENDVSFWGQKKDDVKQKPREQEKMVPNIFDDEDDAIFTGAIGSQQKEISEKTGLKTDEQKKSISLFDDGDNASDDDIFNTDNLRKKLENTVQQHLQPRNSSFDEEQPPLLINEKTESKKKVPIGGISVPAGEELKKALKKRQQLSENSDTGKENISEGIISMASENKTEKKLGDSESKSSREEKKKVSLFDEDVDLFDDLFADTPQKKFSSSLFADVDDIMSPKKKTKSKSNSLFDDLVDDEEVENKSKPKVLFDDDNDYENGTKAAEKKETSKINNLFDDFADNVEDRNSAVSSKKIENLAITIEKIAVTNQGKSTNIFDDDDVYDDMSIPVQREPTRLETGLFSDDEQLDDLFSINKKLKQTINKDNKTNPENTKAATNDEQNDIKIVDVQSKPNKTVATLSLFDDNIEDEDDLFLISPKANIQRGENNTSDDGSMTITKSEPSNSGEELQAQKNETQHEIVENNFARDASNLTFDEVTSVIENESLQKTEKIATSESNLSEIQSLNEREQTKDDLFIASESNENTSITKSESNGENKQTVSKKINGNESLSSQLPQNEIPDDIFDVGKNIPVIQVPPQLKETDPSGHSQLRNIDLFDPTPPPDLENWDTRSENNLFDDDVYSFDNGPSVSGQRSSIFDVEPPSLLANESSGIVRDQSNRNETDESSFFPYASSSRRLSTDWPNEDDSLFSIKTKNVIDSNLLHDIPEVSPQPSDESFTSALDLTPSGNVNDLYSEAATFTDNSLSVAKEKQSDSDKDISKVIAAKHDKGEGKLEKKPPIPKMKPQIDSSKDASEDKSKDGVPGKLKHNLNINVRALLPGALLPKRSLEKSKSLDLSQKTESSDIDVLSEDLLRNSKEAEASHSESSLYDPNDSVQVLQSITKDRVRIPARRRPSTKKGREAIRKSCIDLPIADHALQVGEENSKECNKLTNSGDHKTTDNVNVATESARIMDISNTCTVAPELLITQKAEMAHLESDEKNDNKNLLSVNDGGVFDGIRRTSFVKTDNFESPDFKKSDLFDDEDEDNGDDIFSTKKLPKSDIFKRSLFDDDDDDDTEDIFGKSTAATTKTSGGTKSSSSRRPKSNILKKLENTEVIFDPLDALKK